MRPKIYKHVFSVTVLSEDKDELPQMELCDVLQAIDSGDDIGQAKHVSVEEVPASKVDEELLALGNDGSFFGPDDDDDE